MSPSPSLLMTLVAILGGVLAIVIVLLGVIWARLRALTPARAGRQVEDPAKRLPTLEEPRVRTGPAGESVRAEGNFVVIPRHPSPPSVRLATSRRRLDPAERTSVSGRTLIAIPNLGSTVVDSSESVAVELGRRFGAIWDLADSGATPESIAKGTGQPIGQVELILALRRQLGPKSGSRA